MKAWTGNRDVDAILHDLVAAYDSTFPNARLAYYLIGSWADGESNALSDIDVAIVWTRAVPTVEDRVLGAKLIEALASPIRVDAAMLAEHEVLTSHVGVNLKLSSVLIAGPDIREELPLPPLDVYALDATEAATFFVYRVLRSADDLNNIDYPDPHDEFYGYATKRIDAWYPPDITSGLKEWVSTATRIARALVAIESGRYIGSKREAIRQYSAGSADVWGDYLTALYTTARIEWAYRVPEAKADRDLLRDLCRMFLSFERHFLLISSSSSTAATGRCRWQQEDRQLLRSPSNS